MIIIIVFNFSNTIGINIKFSKIELYLNKR